MTEGPYLNGREAELPPATEAATENTGSSENRPPRVSIGLPVYNGESYLRETLESLLAQTFPDFELVISDNASTDQTDLICREYAAKDKRIRYFRNETNLGAAENHNRVFRLSRGEFFKWAAADDVCAPEFLARCVAALDLDPDAVLACTEVIGIDEQGKHLSTAVSVEDAGSPDPCVRFRRLILWDHGCEQVYGVIRSSVLRHTDLIGRYTGSDRVLLSHLALFGRFALIPEPLFFNRDHPERSGRAHGYRSREFWFWFDPSAKGRKVFPIWRELLENFRAIAQSPLSSRGKARCYMAMGIWLRMAKKSLRWDLQYYPKQWIVRHVPGAKAVLFRVKKVSVKPAIR